MDKVVIAELGVEGGGTTILGRVVGDRWVIWQDGSSIALDANDNEEWRTWESDSAAELSAVVPAKWPLMFPSNVHPDFVGWFRDHYEAGRARLRDDVRAYQAGSPNRRWQEVFGEDVRHFGATAPASISRRRHQVPSQPSGRVTDRAQVGR